MNIGIFTGRLPLTPSLKNGKEKKYCQFRVIQSKKYAEKIVVTGLDLIAFDHTAIFISEHCRKGDKILVNYFVKNSHYIGDDGQEHYKIVFIVLSVEFAGAGKETRMFLENNKTKTHDYFDNETSPNPYYQDIDKLV